MCTRRASTAYTGINRHVGDGMTSQTRQKKEPSTRANLDSTRRNHTEHGNAPAAPVTTIFIGFLLILFLFDEIVRNFQCQPELASRRREREKLLRRTAAWVPLALELKQSSSSVDGLRRVATGCSDWKRLATTTRRHERQETTGPLTGALGGLPTQYRAPSHGTCT